MGVRAVHREVVQIEVLLGVSCWVTSESDRVLLRIETLGEVLHIKEVSESTAESAYQKHTRSVYNPDIVSRHIIPSAFSTY